LARALPATERRSLCSGGHLGHELFYENNDRHIGSMSLRRWDEVAKLLPPMFDYVQPAMAISWAAGTARDVRIVADGGVVPPVPPPASARPGDGLFNLSTMLSVEHLDLNEVYFFRAAEWDRLFAWCGFLKERDGAYELYAPLVLALQQALSELTARP
jgi:hypothetical protein